MCLPYFKEFKQIDKSNPLTGYRTWKLQIEKPINLLSEYQNHEWDKVEGPHEVLDKDSGIYAYNYNNYNYYNNYNNYIFGVINQWGNVAIHATGQRSEFASIRTLFTIKKSDAKGPKDFLNWIDKFNKIIEDLAIKYKCDTIHYQDYAEQSH